MKSIFVGLGMLALLPITLLAQTAEEKGFAIAKEADARNNGWGDSKAAMLMVLRNKDGRESERKLRIQSLEVQGDGDKGLTIFDEPKDVQGTAFLSFSHAVEPDEQWLYLPALKRVKRIASSNKSGPFMGSEFAYEDLSSFEIEKYTYKYIKDDTVNGEAVFVVESYPQYKHSGYSKLITYIDQAEYRMVKVEYFDNQGSFYKTLENTDYKQFLNKYWRAHTMLMTNHQTGKSTVLRWSDYEFQTGVNERDFDKNALKRAK